MAQANPNHILTRSVAAAYLNRTATNKNGRVELQVDEILKTTKVKDDNLLGEYSDTEITRGLMSTIEWLASTAHDVVIAEADLLTRVKTNTGFDPEYLEILKNSIADTETDTLKTQRISSITSEISHELNIRRSQQIIAKYNARINYSDEHVNIKEELKNLLQDIEEIGQLNNQQEKPGFGGRMSLIDDGSMEEVLEKAAELNSDVGLLKTGLKGINNMLGIGGHRRGECFCYGGLTHHYKSGMLLSYCRWFPMHNEPYMLKEDKKPLVIRVTFENKLEQDVPIMYKALYEQKYKKKLDMKNINPQDAAKLLREELGRNGYHFVIECYDPNNFDVWDLIDIIGKYEALGYEVHSVITDYLELITRKDAKKTRQDQAINNAFEIFRNHCFPKGITQIHAHQLSTEAQKLAREGSTTTFAKRVATGSYWMNSQSLSTKLDGEAIMHIHREGEDSWLVVARGKHRGGEDTEVKYRNFAYQFHNVAGILDDVDQADSGAIYNLSTIGKMGAAVAIAGNSSSGADDWN